MVDIPAKVQREAPFLKGNTLLVITMLEKMRCSRKALGQNRLTSKLVLPFFFLIC